MEAAKATERQRDLSTPESNDSLAYFVKEAIRRLATCAFPLAAEIVFIGGKPLFVMQERIAAEGGRT